MITRGGDWIQTFTGRQYWPLDPRADEVDIGDIAHHLSMLCRFTGACNSFYSVAEHSVYVSLVIENHIRLNCPDFGQGTYLLRTLLHDSAEAYCNDIARPVKRSIVGYSEIEGLNEAAIFDHFGLSGSTPAEQKLLKQADNAMLMAEMAVLMKLPPAEWHPVDVPADVQQIAARVFQDGGNCWLPCVAEQIFLERFRELAA